MDNEELKKIKEDSTRFVDELKDKVHDQYDEIKGKDKIIIMLTNRINEKDEEIERLNKEIKEYQEELEKQHYIIKEVREDLYQVVKWCTENKHNEDTIERYLVVDYGTIVRKINEIRTKLDKENKE